MKTDILIVGSGCSGLYCALKLPRDKKILIITKSVAEESDSFLAQGGICVLKDDSDFESFYEDTMRAGHYENSPESVSVMINNSRHVIDELIQAGVDFARKDDGSLDYTREGAHSKPRILFHEDITGEAITSVLLEKARELPNVTLLENTALLDIVSEDNVCLGAVIATPDGNVQTVECDCTVLATGGIGGLYRHSTNFRHLTGDAIAIAACHGVELQNVNYIQIHPTTFYTKNSDEKCFLISESVRGEGAVLRDKNMNRFTDELQARDLLTKAIYEQMEKDGTEHVWEDLRTIPKKELLEHFPNIVDFCAKMGYDVSRDCIPVVPAQHYFMGGVKADTYGRTSMKFLYAVGETACNGVHGKNRLASNSLLESLVFAGRAAEDIRTLEMIKPDFPSVDLEEYRDTAKVTGDLKDKAVEIIKKAGGII